MFGVPFFYVAMADWNFEQDSSCYAKRSRVEMNSASRSYILLSIGGEIDVIKRIFIIST